MNIETWQNNIIAIALLIFANGSFAYEWSGNVALEGRWFAESAQRAEQADNNLSLSFEPELYHRFADSRDSFTFTSFIRLDQNDDDRSHFDIRELYWQKIAADWELTLGINKVFWGVTETTHLVDIINQTDAIENIDGEDKLGQPMAQLTLIRDWGNLELFLLPGFRERTFASNEGRPQLTPLLIDTDSALYESSDEEQHIDYAIRWSNYIGIWDIGLHYFSGTNRDPEFRLNTSNPTNPGTPVLQPFYSQIDQFGIDLQATLEAWLIKLEAISRDSNTEDFIAVAGGIEYTFVGVFDSNTDIGLVAEYLYDERDTQPFQKDLAIGLRFALNDTQSTEILVAAIDDQDNSSYAYFVEASRRLGDSYKLSLELRGGGTDNTIINDPIRQLEQDRFLQAELAYYF